MISDTDFRNFKYINETYGKEAGNALLKESSKYLVKTMKQFDCYIARGFADHFYLLIKLPKNPEYYTYDVLKPYYDVKDIKKHFNVVIKQGIVFINPSEEIDTVENLLGKASYAKKFVLPYSKYPYKIFDAKIGKQMKAELHLEKNFDFSIQNDSFRVYYQPQIDLNTGKLVGAEALVRWFDPFLGLIEPDCFIESLEASGNIRRLDFYVYENVCKFIRKQLDEHKKVVPISVNMSRQHLDSDDFVELFTSLVNKYNVPPEMIKVEILERSCAYNSEILKDIVKGLQSAGIGIAIDDFGSGESSLGMLNEIPVNEIKLDRQFIKKIGTSESPGKIDCMEKITKSVLSLAKQLGKTTICEGAETENQIAFLKTVNCDAVQGFYYSKPLPEERFVNFMNEASL